MSFVQGFERNPQDPTHLQASACCKHYAANSMEDTTEGGVKLSRHTIDANITQQDLIDSYLAPFQACVEQVPTLCYVICTEIRTDKFYLQILQVY